jgi:hypothetical protein
MLESTWRTPPVQKPSRLELAIREWQRQLAEEAKEAKVTQGDTRETIEATEETMVEL